VYWSGSNLTVRNSSNSPVITLDSSGNAQFTGIVGIGTGGELRLGTGNFIPSPPFTGVRIWEDAGIGRFATYNAGVPQVYTDTTGKLLAGGGYITIDRTGIIIEEGGSETSNSSINWVDDTNRRMGYLIAYDSGTTDYLYLKTQPAYRPSSIQISSIAGVGQYSFTNISAEESGGGNRARTYWWSNYNGTPAVVVDSTRMILAQSANDWHILDMRSSDVNHGMTAIAPVSTTFGTMKKVIDADGGLEVAGYSNDNVGINLRGYVVNEVTTTTTSSHGAVMIEAGLKSSTSSTTLGSTGNLLAVRNNGTTRFIVKGNGNFHYDGTGAAYDDYNDIKLLRAADLSLAGRLDRQWEQWLGYNRAAVEGAGIVTFNDDDGGHMVNGAQLDRLLAGTLWQLHERLERLEEQVAS
jgi:hypothetical protein